ncbi:reverse transcriptase domain-containing protein, partial [Dehalococcoidia bacterium]|nr:reverse transcriptase domain-containing protein [Dehalococcoidia bacterium]
NGHLKAQELQRRLYLKSKRERRCRFYSLYDKVCHPDILREAWKRVKSIHTEAQWREKTLRDTHHTIPHEEMMKKVAERIADKNILRLIKGWLKAGVMEEGEIKGNEMGTPQGGVISPLLANIYLNHLDRK